MRRKAVWIGAAAALAGGLGAWAYFRGDHGGAYRTARVDHGLIESTISATGNLNAVVTVEVGTQVSGYIKELHADFNTRVKKGQLVARIDPEIFQARVNQAQANLDASRAAVGNAQAALQKAEAEVSNAQAMLAVAQAGLAKERANTADSKAKFQRSSQLFQSGLIAPADQETSQAQYNAAVAAVSSMEAQVQAATASIRSAEASRDVARTQVTSAQAQVKQQAAALQQTQIDLEHTYITAPVDGVVVSRKVDVGQTVAASLQAPTIFEIAQDLTKMQVDTNVDEADVGRVQVGQRTVFTVDAYPTGAFRGVVTEIRKAPINVQNVITYDVVIGVSNPDLKLFPGMTANVRILTDQRASALRIPNAALRFRPVDAAAAPQRAATGQRGFGARRAASLQTVYVVGADGKPAPVQVGLGITDGTYSEVSSGSLAEGQEVIVGMASQTPATNPAAGSRPGGPRLF
ncbi:MAG: efflux RND transporter periplasmic adaptor subunit [Bryobacteraceae bacterium]|jgi:HlyD family secretion protein